MNKKKIVRIRISYDDVGDVIYRRLIQSGYSPTTDEVLDIADIVMDFLIQFAQTADIPTTILEDDEWEEQ